MRATVRLICSLVLASSVVVCVSAGYQATHVGRELHRELERRAAVLADSLQDLAEPLVGKSERLPQLQRLVERFGNRERLAGVAVYGESGEPLAITASLPAPFRIAPAIGLEALKAGEQLSRVEAVGGAAWHFTASPLRPEGGPSAVLVVFHDAGYIRAYTRELWAQNFLRLFLHVLLISLVTLVMVRWMLIRPLRRMSEWIGRLRAGDAHGEGAPRDAELFGPLTREVNKMARSLAAAKAAAEQEARLRLAAESRWTPERLKEHLRSLLQGRPLVVVGNREPYMHVQRGRAVECIVPASGLVTAVEPILRACGGTWIAHGAGDADPLTADRHGRLRVPPETPLYTLRRLWLTREEEEGYYYGFSNEGLWPLCHIAHTRPIFRSTDWTQYRQVNARFAEAALEEIEGLEHPFVLIQDYHFALVPSLIRARRPDARIALFWHIPWPNPEAFGICPWARELLGGMLGADLLGFHIQYHCNNFLETADRLLESRIDWAQFALMRGGRTSWVKPFPISIAWEEPGDAVRALPSAEAVREPLLKALGVTATYLGVGVDRIDYTKGIAERFHAIERFLERYPAYQGRFTFVELGAPSRMLIPRYHDLGEELDGEAERINRRFQTRTWKPIVFLRKHHSHEAIRPFYQAANVCLVTSLHDGMNLVAKEFVGARTDGLGALILSRFAGASVELQDALQVNPYDTGQVAEAIRYALEMPGPEQRERMLRMRQTLQEHNVYRWAATLVTELARLHAARTPETLFPSPSHPAE